MRASASGPWTQQHAADSEGVVVELHPLVLGEWREDHRLSRQSLLWIHDHADADDPHPVATALAMLRATVTYYRPPPRP